MWKELEDKLIELGATEVSKCDSFDGDSIEIYFYLDNIIHWLDISANNNEAIIVRGGDRKVIWAVTMDDISSDNIEKTFERVLQYKR